MLKNKLKLATEDDVKLIRVVLAELNRQVLVDPSVFTYDLREYHNPNDEFDDDLGEIQSQRTMIKWLTVTFQPGTNANHSHKDIENIVTSYCPHSGEITMALCYNRPAAQGQRRGFTESYDSAFILGTNKELNGLYAKAKMDYIRLYKAVKTWEDEDLPRRNRQRFETAVYETFPGLLDTLLMEDEDDKKES